MKKQLLTTAAFLFTALSSFAQLTNMNPNTGALGQTLTTTITGTGIFIQGTSPSGNIYQIKLKQGANQFPVFEYWNSWSYNVTITSPTTVDAEVVVPITVPPGAYDLEVIIGDLLNPLNNQVTYTLPGAFTVAPPDGYIQGNVYKDVNGNGIKDGAETGVSNQQIKFLPSNVTLQTDVNGDYSIPAMNGTYNVTYIGSTSDYMFVTSLNDTLSVTINNANSPGNDFGINGALSSIDPDSGIVGGGTLHTLVSSQPIFQTSGFPYGNVSGIYVYSSPITNVSVSTTVVVIDPYTIQATIQPPANTTVADSIDIRVSVTGPYAGYHFLRKKYRVNPPNGFVQGQIYRDLNGNGIKDGAELGLSNYYVKLMPSNSWVYTDINGDYSVGAANGNHSITTVPAAADLLFSTTQDTISVNINNGNSTGNDFGLDGALVSVTPSTALRGFAQLHQLVANRPIFIPGANAWGNISSVRIYSTPQINVNVNPNVTVIDSFTVQILINVPANTTIANDLDIRIYTTSGFVGYHYLRGHLDIEIPQAMISGRLFYDSDQDKINDPGEPGILGGKVKLTPDNSIAFSDAYGNFTVGSLGGVQTLTYENNLPGYVLFTDSASYTFNATGSVTGKDFGFLSSAPDYSIEVTTPYTLPRCNTTQPTTFKVNNTTNSPYDAVAWLHYGPNMTYVSSPLPPTSISNDTIYWNVTSIQPQTFAIVQAYFVLPPAGDTIHITAGASSLDAGGVYQLSDAASNTYAITCAWDPNDKAATPPGIFAQNFTLMSDTLEYLIRFQNTGNDTAFKVVVLDTLDNNLDFNTFEVIGSSHSVQTELESNGAVKFTFDNILLPDSNVNEPESNGYVRYSIRADQGLPDNTEVLNTAHIFFDFNPDVVTNTTLNTLVYVLPVGVGELISSDDQVMFYPNPLSRSATLLFENPSAEIHKLSLTSITGNKIAADQTTIGNSFVIEKNKIPKGIYFYNLTNTNTNKSHSGKFIVD